MNLGSNRCSTKDVQALIKPPPIPIIREATEKVEEYNIIKIEMSRDLESATSKTYKLKVHMFNNGKPEEFLHIMKDINTATGGAGTTSATKKNHFLCTILRGESIREFDVLTSQFGSTTNRHLRLIKEGLLCDI